MPRAPDNAEVALCKFAQLEALRVVLRQIDASTTGAQAREVVQQSIDETVHDLELLTDGDRDLVRVMAEELGFMPVVLQPRGRRHA